MKKIRLDLDRVEVESFPIGAVAEDAGTVQGQLASRVGDTRCITCFEDTCDNCTVGFTCDPRIC
jgi:hypothetical protein